MTPLERIRTAWYGTNRAVELNVTVEALARDGASLSTLDDALAALLDEARMNGLDESQEEILLSVGDRLHGWCHESRTIGTRYPTPGSVLPIPNAALSHGSFRPTSTN